MGAWIETPKGLAGVRKTLVAPYVGTWIETYKMIRRHERINVAPYVGAWIETVSNPMPFSRSFAGARGETDHKRGIVFVCQCRSLRESGN